MKSKVRLEEMASGFFGGDYHAIIATDSKGLIVAMNHSAEELTGAKQRGSVGKPLSEVFHLIDSKTRAPVKLPAISLIQKGRKSQTIPHSILVSGKGKETVIAVVLSPMRDRQSKVVGVAAIFYDVSKTVAEEISMRDAHRMAAIGNIASSVAHNLSNWLSVISGHASSIADNVLSNTRAHEEALKIVSATKHAGGLAKRLLSIARVSQMTGGIKTEQVSLPDMVRQAMAMSESSLAGQHVAFKVGDLGRAPYVQANADQLLDCLMNLFLNAGEAMPAGGTIKIDAVEKAVEGRAFVALRVSDTGCGMTKEVLDHIFEPFFTTKEQGSTMGMGLTIVKSSVEQWGGVVKVYSRPGKGATFRLFIPSVPMKSPKETRKASTPGGETILVVDDNKMLLEEAKTLLKEAGYKVHSASSADECVALFKTHGKDISLTIVDVIMPGKDGKNVLKSILEIDPTALIIMTSGFSRDYVRGYLERGAWGFLQKPLDRSQFLSAVRRMLDERTPGVKVPPAQKTQSHD